MKPRRLGPWYFVAWVFSLCMAVTLPSPPVAAQSGQFVVTSVAEKKLNVLPP